MSTEQNSEKVKEYQEVIKSVIKVLKGKNNALCKQALKEIIDNFLDNASTVN
jgi:dihydroneopterin aldolase